MENEYSQTMIGSCSNAIKATPTSTAVGIVPAIPQALLTAMEATVQTNQFDTDLASYAEVTKGIISDIQGCKKISNEM